MFTIFWLSSITSI